MLDAFLGAVELALIGLLELFPKYRKIIVSLIFGLAIVWVGTGIYRFATRHENLVADVSDFIASTNGPFASYLRITNVSDTGRQGAITIEIMDESGTRIGSLTTSVISPKSTMQLSASEIEGLALSTKLPRGGGNLPADKKYGHYFLHLEGKFEGTVQHLIFNGETLINSGGVSYRRR
jgi:hypothetical protein